MNPLEPEDNTPILHRAVPACVLRILTVAALFFVLMFLSLLAGTHVFLDLIFALSVGWWSHGVRVLPDFFENWRSSVLPAAALAVVWWTGHHLLRWWQVTRGSVLTQVWTAGRTAILLALLLLCGAAAIAVSGVAHQMMWLGQTKWTQRSGRAEVVRMMTDVRQCMYMLMEFEMDRGRLPHSWEELLREDEEKGHADFIHHLSERNPLPVMTHPGENTYPLDAATILLISEEVDGHHVLGLADGVAVSVGSDTLDAILASGEMRYRKPQ